MLQATVADHLLCVQKFNMLMHMGCLILRRLFDKLKEVRQLEYELDFAQNRAARDKAALKERLATSLAAVQKLQAQLAAVQVRHLPAGHKTAL